MAPLCAPTQTTRDGFTIMESLVVVAILLILSTIAIPRVLEARTRSNVATVQATMSFMATAMEMYRLDSTAYPPTFHPHRVTSPVAYLTSLPQDAF